MCMHVVILVSDIKCMQHTRLLSIHHHLFEIFQDLAECLQQPQVESTEVTKTNIAQRLTLF